MEFSNSVNKQGLCEDIDFLCGTTTASYPIPAKVRNINQAYYDVNRLIWESCDTWQYDDSNKTDLPITKTTLVDSQQDYSIPSTAQKVHRVEVKDSAGNWVKLTPIDYEQIGIALPEYFETPGLPSHYDLNGNSIYLYPSPSSAYCTLASGMALYVDRDVTLFTSASTTAAPGFAPQFHRLLSLQAALDFEPDSQQRQLFMAEKSNLVEGLKKFYGSREVEKRTSIRPSGKRHHRIYE